MLATTDAQKSTSKKTHIQIPIHNHFLDILKTVACFIKTLHTSPPHQRPTQNQKLLTEEWGRAAAPLPNIFSNPLTTHAEDILHSFSNISYTGRKKRKAESNARSFAVGFPHREKDLDLRGEGIVL